MYTADRSICLTADRTEVVEETDPRAAWLLVGKGGQLSDKDAERYGLLDTEAKAITAAPENKAIMAAENKRQKRVRK